MRRTELWAYINLFGEREVVKLRNFYSHQGGGDMWIVVAEDGTEYITASENFVVRRVEVDEGGDER